MIILTLVFIGRKGQGWKRLFTITLFGLYIVAVIWVIFFPISIPLNWPSNLTWQETLQSLRGINLSPLYFLSITHHPFSLRWLLVDFGLNAILTIPFGFGLGFFIKPKWLKLCLLALLTGLTLEGIQLLVKLGLGTFYHTVDINDVILNALGVIIGYCIYLTLKKVFHKPNKTQTNQPVEKQD